ncbi:hypothetical protein JCM13580A_63320 [Streptomyces drozdowiczii]
MGGHLETVYDRSDGTPPPDVVAAEADQALVDHLRVPFHFASPDVPDDNAPRWTTIHLHRDLHEFPHHRADPADDRSPHLVALVRAGARFENGHLMERPEGKAA